MSKEFYIGYMGEAPHGIARFVRRKIFHMILAAILVALGLAWGQQHFFAATFEFGKVRSFEGIVFNEPYPMLRVKRPGVISGGLSQFSNYSLVALGKFGANELVKDFHGQSVSLDGSLVYQDGQAMIEVVAGSLKSLNGEDQKMLATESLGRHQFIGEIVDSKCYLGVMNPGATKTHKSCAIRCVSGGIPPVLMVRDVHGRASYLMLVNEQGKSVNEQVLGMIAEPVLIEGEVEKLGDTLILKANPEDYQLITTE